MANEKRKLKIIINRLDEGRQYTPEEQFFALYHRDMDDFVRELIDNPDGKYDHLFEQTEESKKAQKKRRARERRAAGGW